MKIGILTDIHIESYKEKAQELADFAPQIPSLCDVLVLSGDMSSFCASELDKCFKIIRGAIPNLPILCVMGNHDFYSTTKSLNSLTKVIDLHKEVSKKYNIHYLQEDGEFILNDVSFVGFNGWYARRNNDTKDYDNIPIQNSYGADTFTVMKKLENEALDKIAAMTIDSPKKVCVTHFNLITKPPWENLSGNPRVFDLFLKDNFDLVIMGHSHKKMDKIIDGCRIVNAGANYSESPENYFSVIEI